MASGDSLVDHEPPPTTPTPSTSDISILQQQQQPEPIQGVKEAFKIPDVLYALVFSILWLFGLARNLASYVVSLGIIPLKTATQLFGIKPVPQTQLHPTGQLERRPGTRHTHLSHSTGIDKSSKSSALGPRSRQHGWNTHSSGKTPSSTITRPLAGSGSLPGTPRKHHRTSLPSEPLTDSESLLRRRSKNRHTAPPAPSSRLVNFRDAPGCVGVSEQGEIVEGDVDGTAKRTRSRSRVDHSTRRILFVDPKNTRRQTAPPAPYQQPPLASGVEVEERLDITELPLHDTVGLPETRVAMDSQHQQQSITSVVRPKSTPDQSTSRPTTNEFGGFVSAPAAPSIPHHSCPLIGDRDDRDAAASGTESLSERRSRGKERFSGFKLFGKKRSNSVTSTNGEAVTSPESKSGIKSASNKLRRKSPYPSRIDSHVRSSTEVVHKQHSAGTGAGPGTALVAGSVMVTVSDAEAVSTSWLRSRPKKLTKRARSNSLSEGSRSTTLPTSKPTTTPPIAQDSTDSPVPSAPNTSPLGPLSSSPTPIPPLPRSSTMASTSTSASNSSTNPTSNSTSAPPTSTTTKRTSALGHFNPLKNLGGLRDLEAHLYYRHGVGTGPSAADVFSSYVTTPVPKSGIKRTNPYVLLGVEPPSRGASSSSALASSSPNSAGASASGSSSSRPTVSSRLNLATPPAPPRRVSAPAGEENVTPLKRPNTPSRAHTQPLSH